MDTSADNAIALTNCEHISKFSLLNNYYSYVDVGEYLADNLFIKHKVRVYFDYEYVNPDIPYHVIICHVRKRDTQKFYEAIYELQHKMINCGHGDYLAACANIWETF